MECAFARIALQVSLDHWLMFQRQARIAVNVIDEL